MIVIDVNTGKFIGKGGNLEETVTKNNLEAAEEIARQLRLRDLGGIVVIDFIDMILESNREAVLRRLVECLGRDRTKHQVAEVTSLGLVQMTRKRVGQGLIEAFSTTCDSCSGRGIHIHMEPVKMKAPAPQIDTPSSQHEDAEEKDATAHEFHESLNQDSKTEEPAAAKVEVKAGGRKRRRASSSGVITA
jgi:ribonuclease E